MTDEDASIDVKPRRSCPNCGGEEFLVFGVDGQKPVFACASCDVPDQ